MTDDVPRQRPIYLQKRWSRHGKLAWYVRVGRGPLIRLRAEYDSPEFWAEYHAAVAGKPAESATPKTKSASLRWLVERYKDSGAWRALSPATQRQRANIFAGVLAKSGDESFLAIKPSDIEGGKEDRRATPSQSRNFLDAMRGLFRWAAEPSVGLVKIDPTKGIRNPARAYDGPGFPAWTEADVDRYEARWAAGSRQRVWLHVLLYTGLRRGDAVRLGRQHVRHGVATIWTEKTGTEVTIPILPVLAATLAVGPTGDLAFICGERGEPLTKESFGNMFSAACRKAGVNKSAHGVRKIGATRAAENGATVAELEALFGWSGGQMAALYTRAADRRRLAKASAAKLIRTDPEQSLLPPDEKVVASGRKDQ